MCAKNYQNIERFDKDIAKKTVQFFCLTWYTITAISEHGLLLCYQHHAELWGFKNRSAAFLAGCHKRQLNQGFVILCLTCLGQVFCVRFLCFSCMCYVFCFLVAMQLIAW